MTLHNSSKVLVATLDDDCTVINKCIPFAKIMSFDVFTSEDRPKDIFQICLYMKDGECLTFVEIGLDSGIDIYQTPHLDDIYQQLLNGDY